MAFNWKTMGSRFLGEGSENILNVFSDLGRNISFSHKFGKYTGTFGIGSSLKDFGGEYYNWMSAGGFTKRPYMAAARTYATGAALWAGGSMLTGGSIGGSLAGGAMWPVSGYKRIMSNEPLNRMYY